MLGLAVAISLTSQQSNAKDNPKYRSGAIAGAGVDAGGGGVDTGGGGVDAGGGTYADPSGSAMSYGDVYSYCPRAISILDMAMMRALNQFNKNRQHPELARATLRKGVQDALRMYTSWPHQYKPLTVEALHRALSLDVLFNNNCGSGQTPDICQSDRRALRFLFGYIQHIKQNILPLDETYYIPFHERGCFQGNCYADQDLWQAFVSHYKEAAISLLSVYVGRGPDYDQPEALGNDIFELRVASKLFAWVAYDLRRDDLNRIFRCEIGELYSASRMLSEQLHGGSDGGVFYDNRAAVLEARSVASRALHNMNGYQCYMRRW
jgi:hypothetical protein